MSDISNDDLLKAAVSPRFAALTQLGVALGDLGNYDRRLVREPRLLVPVDVSALVVGAGDEPMVRLPFRSEEEVPPTIGDAGEVRPPGVHLLWTPPAALGRGTVVDDPSAPGDATRRVLDLPVLPDRWVVIRLAVPVGQTDPVVRGWVVEADTATVTPLEDWPGNRTRSVSLGDAVPVAKLNVHVGGASWTACYDAALGRMAWHDPLDDLDTVAPDGVEADSLCYTVAGWWSDPRHDPLDGVGSVRGYQARLHQLGWEDPDHPAPEGPLVDRQEQMAQIASQYKLDKATRFDTASSTARAYVPAISGFVDDARAVSIVPSAPTRGTLLHGRIHGVPWRTVHGPDARPAPAAVRTVLGPTTGAVAAVLASGAAVTATGGEQQRNAERLLTAFSSGLLSRMEQPDVWPQIDQVEHAQGFGSKPGGVEAVDRFVDAGKPGHDPGAGFRRGRRGKPQFEVLAVAENLLWSAAGRPSALQFVTKVAGAPAPTPVSSPSGPSAAAAAAAAAAALAARTRTVERPAPPYQTPVAPVLAVVGGGRQLSAVEVEEAGRTLRVRTSDQPEQGLDGVLGAAQLLRTIGSGAVPDEVLVLAREALAADPYLVDWRQRRVAGPGDFVGAAGVRMRAEAVVNFGYYAADDTTLSKIVGAPVTTGPARQAAVEGLLKHSMGRGVWAHREGVTMWGQPWRPLFCEWTVELTLADLAELTRADGLGWQLGELDLDRGAAMAGGDTVTLTGRSPLVPGVARSLAAAVQRWLTDERTRDDAGHGLVSDELETALATLLGHLERLDALSVTLDGVRERLLGLRYDRGVVRRAADLGPDGVPLAVAEALPRLVAAGRLTVTRARLIDAFGRVLDLPIEQTTVAARVTEPSTDGPVPGPVMQLRPRFTAPARLHLRLVDPLAVTGEAATALVDQADAVRQVNPVAGFLLPDHIDEALEMFATDGAPLGQVSHDAYSDAVLWEGAPGRTDIGPAAGPLDDTDPAHRRLGWIAAGLVTVDARSRQATPTRPESESPLSALLRAVDTTLWTVDPLGSLGTEHIAGLVGRPIAVVTAHLTLDVLSDVDELTHADEAARTARQQAYAELATVPVAVRLGTATSGDDGLLGYFVDDDYTRLHVIDRAIAERARSSGRCRGLLGVDGVTTEQPIDHPYIVPDGIVHVRPGQTLRLTLLMHPGGKVHLTAGVVPRSSVALARDWVQPGLSVLAPSVRVGPLLIDADKVRLPKVSSFPADQLFTRRDSPGSWKDDAILSATQYAFLPDEASTVQEGWIRIAPNPTAPKGATS